MNFNNIKSFVATAALRLRKHAPAIMTVVGGAGVIAGTVDACRQTLALPAVLDEMKESLDVVHKCEEEPELAEKYTAEQNKKTITAIYIRTAWNLCKLYARPALIILLSLGLILGSNKIYSNRCSDALALAAISKEELEKYRKNVVEKYGEEIDKQLRYGITTSDISELGEDGKEKSETVADKKPELPSEFTRFFDESSGYWKRDAEANKDFLLMEQRYINDILHSRVGKVITLNDVLCRLDLPKMKIGQSVGWVNEGVDENGNFKTKIDFGIFDVKSPAKRDFVNGYERSILLDFNVQGNILGYIDGDK